MKKIVKDFIQDNHKIPVEYWRLCYKMFTCVAETPYEKLRAIFLDAINASGGPTKLDDKLNSICSFHEKIYKCFNNNRHSDFNFFCKILIGREVEKYEIIGELWKAFCKFRQIKEKKSAMIIKYIILFSGNDIFYNIDGETYKKDLMVPVDRVLRELCGIIYNERNLSFEKINEIANDEFAENPILLDDLWFWGHFAMRGDKIQRNDARIKTDLIITESFINRFQLEAKIDEFVKIVLDLHK